MRTVLFTQWNLALSSRGCTDIACFTVATVAICFAAQVHLAICGDLKENHLKGL